MPLNLFCIAKLYCNWASHCKTCDTSHLETQICWT